MTVWFRPVQIAEEGQQLAWQAHIGGFLAGLVLFNAFRGCRGRPTHRPPMSAGCL